jgi:hypothetical protein
MYRRALRRCALRRGGGGGHQPGPRAADDLRARENDGEALAGMGLLERLTRLQHLLRRISSVNECERD